LDNALDWPGKPQPETTTAIRHGIAFEFHACSLEWYPAERALFTPPLQFELFKLFPSRSIFGTHLLDGIRRQAQGFRRASRELMQLIGREKGLVAAKGQQARLITIVPHVIDRAS